MIVKMFDTNTIHAGVPVAEAITLFKQGTGAPIAGSVADVWTFGFRTRRPIQHDQWDGAGVPIVPFSERYGPD